MYQCISSFEPFRVRTSGLVAGILTGAAGAGLLAEPSFAMAGADNSQTLANPTIAAQPFGPDLDGNQIVDMKDLMIMLAVLNGGDHANPAWVQSADVNGDGVIDHADLSEVIANFGRTITPPPPPPPTIPSGTISRTREATGSPGVIRPITPPPPPPPPPPTRLMPGDGFTGLFEVPAVVGNPNAPGADAKAIARWNVVPWQTITGEFNVGVVAFHINGIEKVVFSANGGEEVVVTEMTMNPQSSTAEYWATLDAGDFPDGQVEIRAVVYPNDGVPRALQGPIGQEHVRTGNYSLPVYTNANGSLNAPTVWVCAQTGVNAPGNGTEAAPFQSIMYAARQISNANGGTGDGGTIYLKEGDHVFGGYTFAFLTAVDNRWLHITAAPGLTRDQVRINSVGGGNWANGIRVGLQRLSNLTIQYPGMISSGHPNAGVWVDNCVMIGPGPTTNGSYTDYRPINEPKFGRGVYVTDSIVLDNYRPSRDWQFARNVTLDRIGLDGFFNPGFLVNCEVRNLGVYGDVGHRDVIQYFLSRENTIIYGFRAVENIIAQPLFSRGFRGDRTMNNTAFVNMIFHLPDDSSSHRSQWQQVGNHLLIWNSVFLSLPILFRDDGDTQGGMVTTVDNLSIQGNIFEKFIYSATGTPITTARVSGNHIIDGASYAAMVPGTNVTTGNPQFMNIVAKDFRPAAGSPLRGRMQPVVPFDANSVSRPAMASVGALEP